LGGLIVTHAAWPWIFYLNLPLGVLAVMAALVLIPKQDQSIARSFDFTGFVLAGGASAALLFGMELLGQSPANGLPALALSCAGGMLGVLAWHHMHMHRHGQPLLALEVLAVRTFSVSLWGGSIFRIAISTLPFLLPLMFQLAFGLSALDSGLLVLAVFAGNLAMKPFTTRVMQRWGFRPVLLINGVLGVLAIAACAWLDKQMSWSLLIFILFVGGLSRSMQFTAFNTLGFADVPKEQMSGASTLFSMFFQLSMAMGVAMGALLLRLSMGIHGNIGTAGTNDFQLTFLCVAAVAAVALLDILRLPSKAGESVLQRS
jgi:MFS family permease